jgi:glutaminyl-peptide cyclotransferase
MGRLAVTLLLILAASACSTASSPSLLSSSPSPGTSVAGEAIGSVEVLGSIPHHGAVWTEGLILDGNVLWESTGERTGSGVRAVDPETGDVLWSVSNGEAFFAEGLVRMFGRTYVLSYSEGIVFEFNRDATPPFQPLARYEGQGWGLTAVEDSLVNSNGSSILFYRDPETFQVRKTVEIVYEDQPVQRLNELEYDGRYIWANQWQTHFVYRIDESDPSQVFRYQLPADFCPEGSPNGIAWDARAGVFYVTGQECREIWKVGFR